ncbi:alpha/beta hydrolase-fold protein [Hymenobacter sp.]|uniref:alpha/beta hydrolase-fold protein n=1 Tax=Hymenobacter sp. TaxID=1898978 RepID=UPI00286A11DB|nr:alpha/beta hydrolase-fold protein [Hymenobacter sp.]
MRLYIDQRLIQTASKPAGLFSKPCIDASTPATAPGPAHTGVAGSSLGGLISVCAALKYPRVFGRVGVSRRRAGCATTR